VRDGANVMESDLRPKSSNNILFKYADDTTLLVLECMDVENVVEYQNVKDWARRTGMVINELKTKELVFHRPCPRRCHMGSPIDGIERVTHCKLLGVIVQDTFTADMHVNYILSICSQRIFLLKRLRDQGLPVKHLITVFQALIVSRLLYALPSCRGLLFDS